MACTFLPTCMQPLICPHFFAQHPCNMSFFVALAATLGWPLEKTTTFAMYNVSWCYSNKKARFSKSSNLFYDDACKDLNTLRSLLATIDNSIALVVLVLDCICLFQNKYIVLHSWIGEQSKQTTHGTSLDITRSIHIVNGPCGYLYLVG